MTAVIEASTGHEAGQLAIEHQPDIVLLDVDIPDLNVESLTKHLHQHVPNTRILLLARYDEDARIVSAIWAGAFGYILKDSDWTDFLRILRATVRGEHLLSPALPNGLVHTVPGAMKQPHEGHITRLTNLTDRERDILACASAGRSNKEIADQLCLSVDTVKTHLHHIYQKLSVDGRVSAILTYLQAQ